MCERFFYLILVAAALVASAACNRTPPPSSAEPDRVVIMVFDQMRPDYIDRFNLEHFKRLRAAARHYPDAYIGHLASQTIVSHLVIPTGMAPRELPWQDDAFIDVAGVLGTPGAAYDADELSREQIWRFLERIPRERFLPARINDALGPVFAVGEKDYTLGILWQR